MCDPVRFEDSQAPRWTFIHVHVDAPGDSIPIQYGHVPSQAARRPAARRQLISEPQSELCAAGRTRRAVNFSHIMSLLLSLSLLSAPIPLIIDTDIGGGGCRDVDDVAALCMANALVDNGEAELLGIVLDTKPPPCAGVISVLQQYYDRAHVPIGAYKGSDLRDDVMLSYVPLLVKGWPSPIKNSTHVASSVDVYRRLLAKQPDKSVAIASIGLLTNLAALLRSPPDQHSALDGRQLIAKKVRRLAVMGGKYPSSIGQGCECNFCAAYNGGHDHQVASAASAYVAAQMPPEVPVLYSGFNVGIQVQTGGVLSSCTPPTNPCRAAFIDYEGGTNRSRFSWCEAGSRHPPAASLLPVLLLPALLLLASLLPALLLLAQRTVNRRLCARRDPLTTLVAVRGALTSTGTRECTDCAGRNTVNASSGDNTWSPPVDASSGDAAWSAHKRRMAATEGAGHGGISHQSYLALVDAHTATETINGLLCQPPKRLTSAR